MLFRSSQLGYDNFNQEVLIDNSTVITNYTTVEQISYNAGLYLPGTLFYATETGRFYILDSNESLVEQTDYSVKKLDPRGKSSGARAHYGRNWLGVTLISSACRQSPDCGHSCLPHSFISHT